MRVQPELAVAQLGCDCDPCHELDHATRYSSQHSRSWTSTPDDPDPRVADLQQLATPHIAASRKTILLIRDFDLAGTTTAVWLTRTGFAMPSAIFLLHNCISSLPQDLFEVYRSMA